jgi:NADPH:quinone reductase-like Zn-dependent oxidoreductase
MDAVVIQASGPPAQSPAYRCEPVPQPGPGEVLIEIHAAAVNPLDVANAAGLLGTPLPTIPGGDFAGIIVSDSDHTGQQVWGCARYAALGVTFVDTNRLMKMRNCVHVESAPRTRWAWTSAIHILPVQEHFLSQAHSSGTQPP